jgi:hypothetical protein
MNIKMNMKERNHVRKGAADVDATPAPCLLQDLDTNDGVSKPATMISAFHGP